MVSYENECVGCETCVDCGRKRVKTISCDKCGLTTPVLYDTEWGKICYTCLLNAHKKKFYGDFDKPEEVRCSECGNSDYEDYYEYNGEWVCVDCLLDKYDKARS